MNNHKKLFDKAEIEYITPFLKLWMSFNNWYKKEIQTLKTDRDAINEYKLSGYIKKEFLNFFGENSEAGIEFQNALFNLILNLKNYDLKWEKRDGTQVPINYKIIDSEGNEIDLILENADRRGGKEPIYISTDKRRFQILKENKDKYFEQTLEIIYQIRCNLVHGSFDIENQYFNKLIESSYKILYPIMERILQNETQE